MAVHISSLSALDLGNVRARPAKPPSTIRETGSATAVTSTEVQVRPIDLNPGIKRAAKVRLENRRRRETLTTAGGGDAEPVEKSDAQVKAEKQIARERAAQAAAQREMEGRTVSQEQKIARAAAVREAIVERKVEQSQSRDPRTASICEQIGYTSVECGQIAEQCHSSGWTLPVCKAIIAAKNGIVEQKQNIRTTAEQPPSGDAVTKQVAVTAATPVTTSSGGGGGGGGGQDSGTYTTTTQIDAGSAPAAKKSSGGGGGLLFIAAGVGALLFFRRR